MRGLPRLTALVGGVLLVISGIWAMVDPRAFYDSAAQFPPYNGHFLRDIGAFLIGLGSALLLSLRHAKALTVALAANAIGAALHAVSHVVDRDAGGKSSDPVIFVVIALVLALAASQAMKGRQS
ncbi:MAG: hypothetical protein ABIM89_15535 [Mycobacteriales bacterium]